MKCLRALLVLLCLTPFAVSGQATYPTQAVRFVVSAPAGGGTDIIARLIAQHLGAHWKQSIIVENKTGAGGNIAAQAVARARPDGYTVFTTFGGVMTINPFLYKEMGFDPEKDLVPITLLASAPYVMAVNQGQIPSKNVGDFITAARAKGPDLSWASTAKGSPDHLAGELFSMMAGLKTVHIPYRGAADALVDVLGGRVPYGFFSLPAVLPHLKAGKLTALGVTDNTRSPLLPELPTIAESGLPGYEMLTWFGVWVPAGTPPAVMEKLHSGIQAVLETEAVRQRLREGGYKPGGATPAEFTRFLKVESEKYGRIIRTIGLEKN